MQQLILLFRKRCSLRPFTIFHFTLSIPMPLIFIHHRKTLPHLELIGGQRRDRLHIWVTLTVDTQFVATGGETSPSHESFVTVQLGLFLVGRVHFYLFFGFFVDGYVHPCLQSILFLGGKGYQLTLTTERGKLPMTLNIWLRVIILFHHTDTRMFTPLKVRSIFLFLFFCCLLCLSL